MTGMFAAIAASYVLVATIGFVLGHIHAELHHREARSWPSLDDDVDWARPDPDEALS